jgi:hypothetical protein
VRQRWRAQAQSYTRWFDKVVDLKSKEVPRRIEGQRIDPDDVLIIELRGWEEFKKLQISPRKTKGPTNE